MSSVTITAVSRRQGQFTVGGATTAVNSGMEPPSRAAFPLPSKGCRQRRPIKQTSRAAPACLGRDQSSARGCPSEARGRGFKSRRCCGLCGDFCGDLSAAGLGDQAARCGVTPDPAGRCGVSSLPCGQPHGLKIRVSGVRFPLWPFGVSYSPNIACNENGHPCWVADFVAGLRAGRHRNGMNAKA